MNKCGLYILWMLILIGSFLSSHAQQAEPLAAFPHGGAEHGLKGTHRLTLGLGHTHISEGKVDGKTQWLTMPSWSLNYDYWLSDKWAIGLQNDLILETFIIENDREELIERAYPISIVPLALYKAVKHVTLLGGIGVEIAKGQNLTTTRLGFEYGIHLPKDWEIGAALVWDGKWKYYNSWSLAFTVSRIWPKVLHH